MRLCCGIMDGLIWDASLQPSPEEGSEGRLVVVLSNEEFLSPEDAEFGEFTIMEATAEERAALAQAGYTVPDWTPDQGPACAACHSGNCDEVGQCAELGDEKE